MVIWWIVTAIIALSLLALLAVMSGLRRRVAELERVAALVTERLAGAMEQLSSGLAQLGQRSAEVRRQLPSRGPRRP